MIRFLKTFFPPAMVALAVVGYFMFTGPRMKEQANIRPFQAVMPAMPAGAVPVRSVESPAPTTQEAAAMRNPLPDSPEVVARGKAYYGYYCLACHGALGDGAGPVGESYVPSPADLRSAKVQAYSDGALLRAMLTGVGHGQELARVVPADDRWYIVRYVRSLGRAPVAGAQAGPKGQP